MSKWFELLSSKNDLTVYKNSSSACPKIRQNKRLKYGSSRYPFNSARYFYMRRGQYFVQCFLVAQNFTQLKKWYSPPLYTCYFFSEADFYFYLSLIFVSPLLKSLGWLYAEFHHLLLCSHPEALAPPPYYLSRNNYQLMFII